MDTAQSPDKQPQLDPSHELPTPHDMQLPTPHDMQLPNPHDMLLKPHITHKHTWLHWVPALLGLFIGICVGVFLMKDASTTREQINQSSKTLPVQKQTANQMLPIPTEWLIYTNTSLGYSITYPPGWKFTSPYDDDSCCSRVVFRPPIDKDSTFTDEILDQLKEIGLISVTVTRSNGTLTNSIQSDCQQPVCSISKSRNVEINGIKGLRIASPSALSTDQTILHKNFQGKNRFYKGLSANIIVHKLAGQDPFTSFSEDARLQIYEQMLSSFMFLESTNPTATVAPVLDYSTGPIYCNLDTKQCPDGTWVSRVGPKCEFLPCTTQQP